MSAMQTLLDKLVSQADQNGVTLAEIMTKELSPGDIDRMQQYLRHEMDDNYSAIEGFMQDIEVPDTYDFSSMDESELANLQVDLLEALSDTPTLVTSEA
ncbi:MAG: hypothetical protein LN411_05060 [Candidatus Thermoplasmatota archaeon]|nr:hypothetical protein [Candidatus Thermoplasmatota archaeon]